MERDEDRSKEDRREREVEPQRERDNFGTDSVRSLPREINLDMSDFPSEVKL
jgi:hypothetical protein